MSRARRLFPGAPVPLMSPSDPGEPPPHLSPRETEVLRHMALGRSRKEIATALAVRVGTVRGH